MDTDKKKKRKIQLVKTKTLDLEKIFERIDESSNIIEDKLADLCGNIASLNESNENLQRISKNFEVKIREIEIELRRLKQL